MIKTIGTMLATSVTGAPLLVVFLPPGTWAGYPAAKSDRPLVEFYDRRYDHTLFGQFTGGRYRADDLLDRRISEWGLALDGNIRDWMISPAEFNRVRAWLKEQM